MRAFITGGTGFLGGALARQLREEGHEVVCLARKSSRVEHLREIGAEIAVGDVTEPGSLKAPMQGVDVVHHVAAWYELGVDDRTKMKAINVDGTRYVLEAAAEAGVPKIAYCSSLVALGATRGELGDETHKHPSKFGSAYEETKYLAHEVARELTRAGAPICIAMPGTIFGPLDHSLVALLIKMHLSGRMVIGAFSDLYMSLVYVEDCARGLHLTAEKGVVGGEYNFVGETLRTGAWFELLSEITGLPAPRLNVPKPLVRASAKLFPLIAGSLQLKPGTARDGIAMSDGHWRYSAERARRELGWETTDFTEAWARTLCAFDRYGGARFRPRTERVGRVLQKVRAEKKAA